MATDGIEKEEWELDMLCDLSETLTITQPTFMAALGGDDSDRLRVG